MDVNRDNDEGPLATQLLPILALPFLGLLPSSAADSPFIHKRSINTPRMKNKSTKNTKGQG